MLSIFMPLLWEAGWQLFLVWALWLAWQSIVITRETGLEIDGDGDGSNVDVSKLGHMILTTETNNEMTLSLVKQSITSGPLLLPPANF